MYLSKENLQQLRQIVRGGTKRPFEKRCQCILYRYYGMNIQELSQIFEVDQRSIHNWLNRWQQKGLEGLYDKSGRGKKPKLDPSDPHHIEAVQRAVSKYPYDTRLALAELNRQLPRPVSPSTFFRFRKQQFGDEGPKTNGSSPAASV
ncbi:transposase [Larkinella bovis]|uniref:Transposase n=1 Tax=Larkinella bovis TaxID=683041 RepID=A0ABW0IGT8_9BACT